MVCVLCVVWCVGRVAVCVVGMRVELVVADCCAWVGVRCVLCAGCWRVCTVCRMRYGVCRVRVVCCWWLLVVFASHCVCAVVYRVVFDALCVLCTVRRVLVVVRCVLFGGMVSYVLCV